MKLNSSPRDLAANSQGDTLYFIDGGVWRWAILHQPEPELLVPSRGTIFYALAVSPSSGELYVADAIDYQQPGLVFRISPSGEITDTIQAGINPGFIQFSE